MPLDVDFSGVTGEADLGADWNCKPGRYHVVCLGGDDSCHQSDSILSEYLVLDGTAPGQSGRTIRDWLPTSDKGAKKLHRAILALGLLKPGEKGRVDFSKARGQQLIVEVVEELYNGKTRSKPSFTGYWRLSHPDVKDVPRGTAPSELPLPWWEADQQSSDSFTF